MNTSGSPCYWLIGYYRRLRGDAVSDVGLAVGGFRLAEISDLDVLVEIQSICGSYICLRGSPNQEILSCWRRILLQRDVKSPHTKRAALFCTFSR